MGRGLPAQFKRTAGCALKAVDREECTAAEVEKFLPGAMKWQYVVCTLIF